jgi:Activator of Hsp90 ATPase homolog 1-like protein
MTNTGTLQLATRGDREIVFTRVFNAPRTLVWDTKPELLKRWFFGPPGWSLTVCEVATKAGDKYRYVWRGADRSEMGMGGVCREYVPPERIVATQKFETALVSGRGRGHDGTRRGRWENHTHPDGTLRIAGSARWGAQNPDGARYGHGL